MYIRKILIITVGIGIVFFGLFAFYVYRVMFVSNTSFNSEYVDVYIKTGTTHDELLNQLDPYLININDFSVLAKRKTYKVRAGKYRIKRNMNNREIINSLRSNNITIDVIFNNIKDLEDLAEKISNQIEADSISLLNSFKTEFFKQKGFDEKNILSMFIPNSYNFFWNTSAEQFNDRMFEEYNNFWKKNNRTEKAKNIGLSKNEVMVLASIVYEESKQNIELNKIAGVYMNRLKSNWKLQADPTVKFAAYKQDEYKNTIIRRVLNKHLQINSPYNTYIYYGLPPGIISMPSIQSIDAVLNYEKHNYYFFAADPTNPGYHSFAKSLSEHKRNAKKFHKYLDSRGVKK